MNKLLKLPELEDWKRKARYTAYERDVEIATATFYTLLDKVKSMTYALYSGDESELHGVTDTELFYLEERLYGAKDDLDSLLWHWDIDDKFWKDV